MKVLIYSQDGFGLGHLRRNLNICLQIKKRRPGASILIIADSPVAPFFKLPPKCDFIKIPTIVKVDMGVWQPERLPVSYRELFEIRAEIIRDVALTFRPDVFLVDHMPNGALGELAKPLAALKRYSPETRVVLGLRDILGEPSVICRYWQTEGAYDAVEAYYSRVFVYGCSEIYDFAREYRFPEWLATKMRYCGYVCREHESEAVSGARGEERDPARERFILVTGGGGKDASYFMDKFIDAVKLLKGEMKFKATITTGPFMHEEQLSLLHQKADGLPIAISDKPGDSIEYLKKADLVISMAGYNTISEILHFRKNAIIVPRPGPSAEQSIRSQIMSARGLFSTIHPTELSDSRFANLIFQRLHNNGHINEAAVPDLHGASKMACFIENDGVAEAGAAAITIGDGLAA